MKLSLSKDKKLKSRKSIEQLFSVGKGIHRFPVRAVYFHESGVEKEFKIGVSVPKKKFRKAVERNLLKRRIKEAVRLNQFRLEIPGKIHIMFIFTGTEILSYSEIEKSVIALFDSLNSILNGQTSKK